MNDLRQAAQQALEYMKSVGQADMYPEEWAIVGRLEAALAQQAEPVRSQQMADAGFKPRDRRLECDECGGKFTAQMLPIHKCAQQAEPLTIERLRDALVASRIIPPAAVEDPDGYDDGVTLFRIEALHRRIT